jgi:hypothetical protein
MTGSEIRHLALRHRPFSREPFDGALDVPRRRDRGACRHAGCGNGSACLRLLTKARTLSPVSCSLLAKQCGGACIPFSRQCAASGCAFGFPRRERPRRLRQAPHTIWQDACQRRWRATRTDAARDEEPPLRPKSCDRYLAGILRQRGSHAVQSYDFSGHRYRHVPDVADRESGRLVHRPTRIPP